MTKETLRRGDKTTPARITKETFAGATRQPPKDEEERLEVARENLRRGDKAPPKGDVQPKYTQRKLRLDDSHLSITLARR
jgi:hypothetical protein